jgi:hypothetical protein
MRAWRGGMIVTFPEYDLTLSDHEGGIHVRQHGRVYQARSWKLTPDMVRVVTVGIDAGLHRLWQEGHPRARSSHHISFSRSHERASWVFCAGDGDGAPKVNRVTVSNRYADVVRRLDPDARPEKGGGKNFALSFQELDAFLTEWLRKRPA